MFILWSVFYTQVSDVAVEKKSKIASLSATGRQSQQKHDRRRECLSAILVPGEAVL